MGQRMVRLMVAGAAGAMMLAALALAPVPAGAAPVGPPAPGGVLTAQVTNNFWLVTAQGRLYSFGVPADGSPGGAPLNRPIVDMVPTAGDRGYWMVASDGGIFSYGDARFYGSTGNLVLNKPIVGMTSTPDGRGYWMVASDGGIFSFGDAAFYGSTGALRLTQPIVGMDPTPDGKGYWLVAADGGVFAFGDAHFYGSTAGRGGDPVERLVTTRSGHGYWIVQQNGTSTAFGDAASQSLPPVALVYSPVTPGDKAVLFAFLQLGKPYIWGGNGPVGYDCSGLALAAWTHGAGIGFARVADDQYHTAGVPVPLDRLQAGDLVFWGDNAAQWSTVYHTAIYVGGNRIVESTGDHVQLNVLDQWGTDDLMPNGRHP